MKTTLITGSTDGIGKLAAVKLAKEGHKVILHGRNNEKLQNAIAEIKSLAEKESVVGYVADLSNFNSIPQITTQILKSHSKIDVLINNAGVFKSKVQQNENNLDIRFAVNYFAPFLLTNGLVESLKKSDSPRVINLGSAAQATVSLEALRGNELLSEQEAYAQSKLALTMWSFYFAKTHPEINTIAVNPGSLLNTKMVKEAYGQHWSSADKGAGILYDLATSETYANSSGMYFDNDKGDFNTAHPDAYDQEKITRLILETQKIVNR
ncbi:MAG: SDR family NAD(P)-dependent oxidoreductase [Bacteroidota bacterium]